MVVRRWASFSVAGCRECNGPKFWAQQLPQKEIGRDFKIRAVSFSSASPPRGLHPSVDFERWAADRSPEVFPINVT